MTKLISNQRILIGAHMSIAGGLNKAFERARETDSTAMQIFTHSNRQWDFKDIPREEVEKFKSAQHETNIIPIVHASYLINLCSESKEVQMKSKSALEKELRVAENLGINYVVMHPGYGSLKKSQLLENLASYTNFVLENSGEKTSILFENMAGQKNAICSSFEELAEVYERIENKERVNFCLDTCHAWAFGYDFSLEEGYKKMLNDFDSILGLSNLKVIHLNDSKKPLGSKVDRHEFISKGTLGIDAFKFIMNDHRLAHIPKILEIPAETLDRYKIDIDLLRNLIRS